MFGFLSTEGGTNYSGYSNPELDTLLTDATATNDIDERADIYGQAVDILQEENPIIYLYRLRSLTAYSTDIAGVETFADGVVHLSHAAFVEAG
jgi:peptide/nickel transport system substrate-binding protein